MKWWMEVICCNCIEVSIFVLSNTSSPHQNILKLTIISIVTPNSSTSPIHSFGSLSPSIIGIHIAPNNTWYPIALRRNQRRMRIPRSRKSNISLRRRRPRRSKSKRPQTKSSIRLNLYWHVTLKTSHQRSTGCSTRAWPMIGRIMSRGIPLKIKGFWRVLDHFINGGLNVIANTMLCWRKM